MYRHVVIVQGGSIPMQCQLGEHGRAGALEEGHAGAGSAAAVWSARARGIRAMRMK